MSDERDLTTRLRTVTDVCGHLSRWEVEVNVLCYEAAAEIERLREENLKSVVDLLSARAVPDVEALTARIAELEADEVECLRIGDEALTKVVEDQSARIAALEAVLKSIELATKDDWAKDIARAALGGKVQLLQGSDANITKEEK